MIQPYRECPRFNECSVNRCPLDAAYPNQFVHKQDKQQICPMEKPVRVRIAAKYQGVLPMEGMTTREWAKTNQFNSLSVAQRTKLSELGKSALASLRNAKQENI